MRGDDQQQDGESSNIGATDHLYVSSEMSLLWALLEKSLVAARVGTRYLESMADPYGDADAAIWIPRRRRNWRLVGNRIGTVRCPKIPTEDSGTRAPIYGSHFGRRASGASQVGTWAAGTQRAGALDTIAMRSCIWRVRCGTKPSIRSISISWPR
jgi:hypothetical protein